MPYKLTLKEMIADRERISLIKAQGRIPKFNINEEVKVVTVEPDLGGWTHMDGIRLERKGEPGIIIDRGVVDPEQEEGFKGRGLSCFDYRVRFADGKIITFVEEHLKKYKRRNLTKK